MLTNSCIHRELVDSQPTVNQDVDSVLIECQPSVDGVMIKYQLRMVPTKYQGFCAKLGPRGKSRSLKGLLESTKKNWGSHAFFRDN